MVIALGLHRWLKMNSVAAIGSRETIVYWPGIDGHCYRRIRWLAYACGIGTDIAAAEDSPIIDLAHSCTTDRAGGQVN